MNFVFPSRTKVLTYILMVVGVLSIVYGYISGDVDHHQRWWANILINGFFFFAIALGALFFYALQYAAEVGWSAQLKRLFEAMYSYLPIGIGVVLIVVIVGAMHGHHLYHWMDSAVYDPESDHYDELIANKQAYFGWFYWVRTVAYVLVFLGFARMFRKWSLAEDEVGGLDLHKKMYKRGALFLVFFAVFSSTLSWDWLMSIDTHWFSTMYGWYVFSGMWVTCMIFVTLMTLWLKKQGYLPNVNESIIHDLGKWMFAISMLWSYLWFCQFMLIWYSNIPEEVIYFYSRIFSDYKFLFFAMFLINFAVPFYALVARDAKRNPVFLVGVGILIFVAHYVDVYLLVIPGTIESHTFSGILWHEFGTFIGFLGLFIHVVLRSLAKAPLIPRNHPFLKESETHHI
jgi:hypothetical protein